VTALNQQPPIQIKKTDEAWGLLSKSIRTKNWISQNQTRAFYGQAKTRPYCFHPLTLSPLLLLPVPCQGSSQWLRSCSSITSWSQWPIFPGGCSPTRHSIPSLMTCLHSSSRCLPCTALAASGMVGVVSNEIIVSLTLSQHLFTVARVNTLHYQNCFHFSLMDTKPQCYAIQTTWGNKHV